MAMESIQSNTERKMVYNDHFRSVSGARSAI